MGQDALQQFERYAEAVNADRYRVTVIRLFADGTKKTLILDKRDGVTRGFTPYEIGQHMPEMERLERRGENLYYTPLSERRHHIVIDDMHIDSLKRLIADGYKPAVLIESSPGNYQAVITIPKFGASHDRDVGNRLAEVLNREYGDPKLSGAIHPHRAPGFQNRKPKHRREDGTYPVVRLLKAERRECAKTLELARKIAAECVRQAEKTRRRELRMQAAMPPDVVAPVIQAYWAHHKYLQAFLRLGVDPHHKYLQAFLRLGVDQDDDGELDLSRLDSMIAVRLRVTGYSRKEIEAALRECAPQIRQGTHRQEHNWDDYVQRTMAWAYSEKADEQIDEKLWQYREFWKSIERRARAASEGSHEPHA